MGQQGSITQPAQFNSASDHFDIMPVSLTIWKKTIALDANWFGLSILIGWFLNHFWECKLSIGLVLKQFESDFKSVVKTEPWSWCQSLRGHLPRPPHAREWGANRRMSSPAVQQNRKPKMRRVPRFCLSMQFWVLQNQTIPTCCSDASKIVR